jgi:DNA uptake protein ComE-like DNA-binding protein
MAEGERTFRFSRRPGALWTRSMRLAAAVAAVLLLTQAVRVGVASDAPPLRARPERINPNTASVASLMRLPGIGRARAIDIVHFRAGVETRPAFQSPADLQAVKGIGPKTAETIAPYLTFATGPDSE